MLISEADIPTYDQRHFSCDLQSGRMLCFFFSVYTAEGKLAEAEWNHNPLKRKCHNTNSASRWPVVQLSHRRSPLHTRISCSSVRPRTICSGLLCYQCDQTNYISKRQRQTRSRNTEDTAHSGCRFPLIHLIRQGFTKPAI